MSDIGREWDIGLSKAGSKKYPVLSVNIPTPISKALMLKGLYRATVTVTEHGILVTPYEGAVSRAGNRGEVIELPDWSAA